MALTAKRKRFVAEYLLDLNATAAAGRAGYKDPNIGRQLITKNNVSKAIEEAMKERGKRTEVTIDRVVEELKEIAFYDPADLVSLRPECGPENIAKLPEDIRRAIAGWSWDKAGNFTVRLASKISALELLGRHLGMFRDVKEVKGRISVSTIADLVAEEDDVDDEGQRPGRSDE